MAIDTKTVTLQNTAALVTKKVNREGNSSTSVNMLNSNQRTAVNLFTKMVTKERNGSMTINVIHLTQLKVGDPVPISVTREENNDVAHNKMKTLGSAWNPATNEVTGSASGEVIANVTSK